MMLGNMKKLALAFGISALSISAMAAPTASEVSISKETSNLKIINVLVKYNVSQDESILDARTNSKRYAIEKATDTMGGIFESSTLIQNKQLIDEQLKSFYLNAFQVNEDKYDVETNGNQVSIYSSYTIKTNPQTYRNKVDKILEEVAKNNTVKNLNKQLSDMSNEYLTNFKFDDPIQDYLNAEMNDDFIGMMDLLAQAEVDAINLRKGIAKHVEMTVDNPVSKTYSVTTLKTELDLKFYNLVRKVSSKYVNVTESNGVMKFSIMKGNAEMISTSFYKTFVGSSLGVDIQLHDEQYFHPMIYFCRNQIDSKKYNNGCKYSASLRQVYKTKVNDTSLATDNFRPVMHGSTFWNNRNDIYNKIVFN